MSEPKRPLSTAPSDSLAAAKDAGASLNGQRRLIRPSLSAAALAEHRSSLAHNGSAVLTARTSHAPEHPQDSHAEAFYFQKQLQMQTRMVVVLENGEHIEGTLEWYDRDAIKLRSGPRQRTMIYKSSIKYLYKAAESTPPHSIMQ